MAKIIQNIVILAMIVHFLPLSAQNNVTITGKVTDKDTQEPLVGASIKLIGTKSGSVTSIEGAFTLSVKELPATIVVEYLGYKQQEIDVYEASETLEIALSENQNILNQVVVTGYTSQRRNEISGIWKTSAGNT